MAAANDGQFGLGAVLKALMKERSLSMRKLGARTGIDTATISRIASGKQQAKPEHLRLFAAQLGVPPERLFQAAGYAVFAAPGELAAEPPASAPLSPQPPEASHPQQSPQSSHTSQSPHSLHESVDSIRQVLLTSNLLEPQFTKEHVRKELSKYEQYARTEEGARTIHGGFRAKIDSVDGTGPFIDQLRELYALFGSESAPAEKRAVAGSALLYFILSADIIPDYVFPFGYLDDAIAVQLVLDRLAEIPE